METAQILVANLNPSEFHSGQNTLESKGLICNSIEMVIHELSWYVKIIFRIENQEELQNEIKC